MDGLTLLSKARTAGLELKADGDRLVIRGPRRAEPLVKELLALKSHVLEALADENKREASENEVFDFEREAAQRKQHPPVVHLMSQLVSSGFEVRADGDYLSVFPPDLLTAAQCRAIAKYRLELLALAREVDAICEALDRIGDEPTGPGLPVDVIQEWLRTPTDIPLTDFLQNRNREK